MPKIKLIETFEEIEPGINFIKESAARELKEIYADHPTKNDDIHIFILKDSTPECDLWITTLAGTLKILNKTEIKSSEIELTERCSWSQLQKGIELYEKLKNSFNKNSIHDLALEIEKFSKLLPYGHLSSKRALAILQSYYQEIVIPLYDHHLHTEQENSINSTAKQILCEIESTQCTDAKEFLTPIKKKLLSISKMRYGDCSPEIYLFNLSSYCLWLADQSIASKNHTSALIFLHRACDTLMQSLCVGAGVMRIKDRKIRLYDESKSEQPVYLSTALDLLPNAEKAQYIFTQSNAEEIRKINGLRNECIMAHGENGIHLHHITELILTTKNLFNQIIGDRKWTVSSEAFNPIKVVNIEKLLLSASNAIPSYFKYGINDDTTSFNWSTYN